MAKSYIVMGVSGSGKTTIGKLLATHLGLPFYDADDFHPKANIEKMSQGISLNDADRLPWLKAMQEAIQSWDTGGVLACSALKEKYREILATDTDVSFVFLQGDFDTIYQRMQARAHFMKPDMLQSQFDTLEPPSYGIHINIDQDTNTIITEIMEQIQGVSETHFGMIGMGVMGRSLAKNIVSKGHRLSVYNRITPEEADVIPKLLQATDNSLMQGYTELNDFVSSLSTPRTILLMVPAGKAVDSLLTSLLPLLDAGDTLMDGGNSHYTDTQARAALMENKGLNYLGVGVSGGEYGALTGPSMMVGGSKEAFTYVKPLLESIAAKAFDGSPCVGYFGTDGAGHFVKTIHNGIEYAEMQLLAEVYSLLKPSLSYDEMVAILSEWNTQSEASFLLETTIEILQTKEGSDYLLDSVLDVANSKGTGVWSSLAALELGEPANMLMEAVVARSVSKQKEERISINSSMNREHFEATIDTEQLQSAYAFARTINHLQGLQLIATGAQEMNWDLDLAEVLRVWSNGCILRSKLVEHWHGVVKGNSSLLTDKTLMQQLAKRESAVMEVLLWGNQQRTPLPCLSAAWQYWLGMSTEDSAANLIQAQRDAFGAHGYQRIDKPQDEWFTSKWNKHG